MIQNDKSMIIILKKFQYLFLYQYFDQKSSWKFNNMQRNLKLKK